MRVLFDTDVVLDLLMDRKPHAEAADQVLSKAETGDIDGYLCATTVTTIHYLATKAIGAKKAIAAIRNLLSFLDVASVDRLVLEGALEGKYKDFEDGVLAEAAHQIEAKAIVTRNIRNYRNSVVPAYSPTELLKIFRVV